ncbi:hypothetical protein A2W24_04230 [Microgenomates group bacterium RBG_16_45_19]|nr:MAG: hypothetical protein A2W24_04230 [Microgenomates group bacterium RBG_16_45_19]
MKRVIVSLVVVAVVAITAFSFSQAFFSDTETSSGNTLQAGALDLKVDNTSYYNGVKSTTTSWELDDLDGHKFFDFADIKPGDWGEDTISLHVQTNDAWACYNVTVTANNDVSSTEPELGDGDLAEDPNNAFDGELAQNIQMAFWLDDGDNVYEVGESIFTQGSISQVAPALKGALADSLNGILGLQGQPMSGLTTYYLAKAWCFGNLTLNQLPEDAQTGPDVRPQGISCDGSGLNNLTQTDQVLGDISFSVVQSRHNPGYVCEQACVTRWADKPTVGGNFQGLRKNNTAILADRTDPNDALVAESLGTPYDNPVQAGTFFSLGFTGGNLTVEFNQPIVNNPGPDLKIYEVTGGTAYPDEIVKVEASQDNSTWVTLSAGLTRDNTTDLGSLPWAKYVRLTEASDINLFEATADGYDLDGVQYICPTII